jgi:hemoglobin-like flavoprotein
MLHFKSGTLHLKIFCTYNQIKQHLNIVIKIVSMITEEQIILIKKTWRALRDVNPEVIGSAFYGKLFTDTPSLRRMFLSKMDEQYKKLMDMLSTIVARLDKLDELAPEIAAMAQRHVEYGVKPEQYAKVGEALLWTLQQGLGKDWNEEVSAAWLACYTMLADTMINASSQKQTIHS